MSHGRETTMSLNLSAVCILIPDTKCFHVTGRRGVRWSNFEFCGLWEN